MSIGNTVSTGPAGTPDTIVTCDSTVASGSVEITGKPWVNAANDIYNTIVTTRYNRTRFIRLLNYTPCALRLFCQGIPGGDGNIAVMVNGTLFQNITVANTTAVPAWYPVVGMPTGAKTIEIREDFQEHAGGAQLNTGVDEPIYGTYVLKVAVPSGQTLPVPAQASTGNVIAALGDSHMDGIATVPCAVNGWVGQLRTRAEAAGWELGYVGAGSSTLCGDGLTAAQTASLISAVWSQMGAKASGKHLLMMRRPNDYAYYNLNGFGTTPTQYGQYIQDMQTALDVSDPGWTGIYTRIPQGTGWGANTGGFTLADYWSATVTASTAGGRTNVQTFDGSVDSSGYFGLVLASDYVEAPNLQVHPQQSGEDKIYNKIIAAGWYAI